MSRHGTPITLYLSAPHPCHYLPDRAASELWVDPNQPVSTPLYGILAAQGFRRSGDYLYRPHCSDCQACIPVRIDCAQFRPSRSQRRCLQRNHDLRLTITDTPQADFLPLYRNYIHTRHAGGAMDDPKQENPLEFLASQWCHTQYYAFRHHDTLLAVSTVDVLPDGLSAVYTFFDPDHAQRGLGNLAILRLIEIAQQSGLPWVYLGYWIAQCQKMSYKNRFHPMQYYLNNNWRTCS